MSDRERAPTPPDFLAKVWECEGDGETIMRLYATALAQARAEGLRQAAEEAEAVETYYAGHAGQYDTGARHAATNIAREIRAAAIRALAGEAGND